MITQTVMIKKKGRQSGMIILSNEGNFCKDSDIKQ